MVFRQNKNAALGAKHRILNHLKWWHILILCLVLVLAGLILHLCSILNQETIYPGISVDGIDVGGLTREEALVLLRANMELTFQKDGIQLITPLKQYRLPFHDIGYEAEYGKALDLAYSRGRQGNIFQRLMEIRKLRKQSLQIIAEMCYDKEKTIRILDSIRQDTERKPKNASISVKSGIVKVTPHQTGYMMDMKLSLGRVEESLLERTLQDVDLCIVELTPDIPAQMLDKITTRLAEFHTVFSTANEGRVHNIKTASGKIDQKVLLPGEVFSMDRVLGDRTEKNGYKPAKVIVNNELVDGLGGGICQVTSTFYNTVLLSGLEIVERRNHTLPLTYIDVGRDATISQGYIDFKFKNNLGYAVLVEARVTGSQVSVSIWGRKPQTENSIRIKTKITEKTQAQGVEAMPDPSLKPGEEVVVREAVPGCRVEVYRETVDPSGKVIKTEKISVDKYLPQKKKIRISPISAIDTEQGKDMENTAQGKDMENTEQGKDMENTAQGEGGENTAQEKAAQ